MIAQNNEMPKRYVGTKTLKAWPRTKAEYCVYRGWNVPENEDPAENGYMVEYEDGGKPNLDNHKGYVSWSPADVFEAAYKEIPSDWRARVVLEKTELQKKLVALQAFFETSQYADLSQNAKVLLRVQEQHMRGYLETMETRLKLAASET